VLIVCVALQEFKRLMQEADLGLSVNHIKLLYSQVRSCAATERAPQPKTECECGVQADVNEDGCIEYREFIPACVELIITLQQQRIAQIDKEEKEMEAQMAAEDYFYHGAPPPASESSPAVESPPTTKIPEAAAPAATPAAPAPAPAPAPATGCCCCRSGRISSRMTMRAGASGLGSGLGSRIQGAERGGAAGMSREELELMLRESFKEADTDGSGFLDMKEFQVGATTRRLQPESAALRCRRAEQAPLALAPALGGE
jgi:hypothetical protein